MRNPVWSCLLFVSSVPLASAAEAAPPRLFQSDMSLMAGMTAEDPMAGMTMPGWHFMDMGVFRLGYNRQSGPSGDTAVESTNWNMAMAQRDVAGGRLTLMLMNWRGLAVDGFLKNPEALVPGNTHRTTASVPYGAAGDGPVAAILL